MFPIFSFFIGNSSPIGYDLWQKNTNDISHIDSDDTDHTTCNNKSSPEDCYTTSSPSIIPLLTHPSSNYVYKNEPLKVSLWLLKRLKYKFDKQIQVNMILLSML